MFGWKQNMVNHTNTHEEQVYFVYYLPTSLYLFLYYKPTDWLQLALLFAKVSGEGKQSKWNRSSCSSVTHTTTTSLKTLFNIAIASPVQYTSFHFLM